jgi:hypothetical protein
LRPERVFDEREGPVDLEENGEVEEKDRWRVGDEGAGFGEVVGEGDQGCAAADVAAEEHHRTSRGAAGRGEVDAGDSVAEDAEEVAGGSWAGSEGGRRRSLVAAARGGAGDATDGKDRRLVDLEEEDRVAIRTVEVPFDLPSLPVDLLLA